jgi:hypothetical protein
MHGITYLIGAKEWHQIGPLAFPIFHQIFRRIHPLVQQVFKGIIATHTDTPILKEFQIQARNAQGIFLHIGTIKENPSPVVTGRTTPAGDLIAALGTPADGRLLAIATKGELATKAGNR